MKRIILITFFFSLLITSAFSQNGKQFKLDTIKRITYTNPLNLENIDKCKGLSYYNKCDSKLLSPNFMRNNSIANQNQIKISEGFRSNGEMPCLIPEGYFPMRIVAPDSSKRYTLLIKEL